VPFSVTVPAEVDPPWTVDGLKVIEATATGTIVSIAVAVFPFRLAVIVAEVAAVAAVAVTVKIALDWPDKIVTELGTDALRLLLARPITKPLGFATPLIRTVPFDVAAPATVEGFNVTDVRTGGLIESVAWMDDPFKVAVIVEIFTLETPTVVTENVAEV
jgi:hypothetical protein